MISKQISHGDKSHQAQNLNPEAFSLKRLLFWYNMFSLFEKVFLKRGFVTEINPKSALFVGHEGSLA